MSKYQPKIKLAIELNPEKFQDTKLICIDGIYKIWSVGRQPNCQWLGCEKYLQVISNAIIGDLYQSKKLTNFANKVKYIKKKILKADYPLYFPEGINRNFQFTLDEENLSILIDIPFCDKNKNKSKDFIKQFCQSTNGK